MTEENFLLKVILLTVFVLLLSYTIFEITKTRLTHKRRIKISAIGALILVSYSFVFLQGHSFLFNQESILSAKIIGLRRWLTNSASPQKPTEIKSWLGKKQEFIFINTAYNHEMAFFGDAQDSTALVLSNRNQLIAIFKGLSTNSKLIDLVSADLLFPASLPKDSALFESMAPLQKANKLVLAKYDEALTDNNSFYKKFDPSVYGDVTKQLDEPIYYSHDIYNDKRGLSFAYQMYCKLNQIDPDKEAEEHFIFRNFITEFTLPDESMLFTDPLPPALKKANNKVQAVRVRSKYKPANFTLGNAVAPKGLERITQKLTEIHSRGSQAVIFIGNLTDEYIDVHHTAYGDVHGATIVLNEFNYLNKGYHLMSYTKLAAYLVTLFLFFGGVIYLILLKASHTHRANERNHSFFPGFFEWAESILKFIWDESYYLLILAMGLVINICFHKLLNIAGLIYLLPLLSSLFRYFANARNRQQ